MTYKDKLLNMYPHLKVEHISPERRDSLSSEEFKKLLTNLLKK